jgi:CheY-like chemotaxis protein/HPt (histidine-containing phosphotransfer) domain-containing protein
MSVACAPSPFTPAKVPTIPPAARILLAEDSPVNREVAVGMLELLGFAVEVAGNGKQAFAAADAEHIDLVLMDCQMPEMDGLTATVKIREREISLGRHRIPIIALTAHAMQGDRDQCLAAGMDDYLTKPYSQMQLRDMILKWLPKKTDGNSTSLPGALPFEAVSMSGPSALMTDPPVKAVPPPTGINFEAMAHIRALQRPNRPNVLASVLRKYLDNSRDSVGALRDAIRANNPEAIQAIAHRLKSSSAQLGAIAVAAHCQELETMGSRKNLIEADHVLAQLELDYHATCTVFRNEITKGTES